MAERFLNGLPFEPDANELAKKLRIRPASGLMDDFYELLAELRSIARPKAFYKQSAIQQADPESLVIDGVTLRSRVLVVNLGSAERVFPYLATCGVELAEWRAREPDLLRQYWADAVMEAALRSAVVAIQIDLADRFQVGALAAMNPGSLVDWPLVEQRPFFELLGEQASQTGVQLTDSMLMLPAKSVSGLFFETDSGFVNCQLCPRQDCSNRRAPYNPHLLEAKYLSSPPPAGMQP